MSQPVELVDIAGGVWPVTSEQFNPASKLYEYKSPAEIVFVGMTVGGRYSPFAGGQQRTNPGDVLKFSI